MVSQEQARFIAVETLKKVYSNSNDRVEYVYFRIGEVGDWWTFNESGPNGETCYGGGTIFVSKKTGEAGLYCWPNSLHPAQKKYPYVSLSETPIKVKYD